MPGSDLRRVPMALLTEYSLQGGTVDNGSGILPASPSQTLEAPADGLGILHSAREGQVAAPNSVKLTGVDRIDRVNTKLPSGVDPTRVHSYPVRLFRTRDTRPHEGDV